MLELSQGPRAGPTSASSCSDLPLTASLQGMSPWIGYILVPTRMSMITGALIEQATNLGSQTPNGYTLENLLPIEEVLKSERHLANTRTMLETGNGLSTL